MIIGINGKIGHGKDTVGSIIQYLTSESRACFRSFDVFLRGNSKPEVFGDIYRSDWEIKKYAAKLKAIVGLLIGVDPKHLEDNGVKNSTLPSMWNKNGEPITVRQALQWVGTEAMRNGFHTDVWVNALFSDYVQDGYVDTYNEETGITLDVAIPKYPKWIVTDMRFPNEMEAIKKRGVGLAKTVRVVRDNVPTVNHPSETSLDLAKFDYVIQNNGTIEQLIFEVEKMLVSFGVKVYESKQA